MRVILLAVGVSLLLAGCTQRLPEQFRKDHIQHLSSEQLDTAYLVDTNRHLCYRYRPETPNPTPISCFKLAKRNPQARELIRWIPAKYFLAPPANPVPATVRHIGPTDALITIVEFSDFQCPYCSRATNTINRLLKIYGNDIAISFRQLPLSFHRDAFLAAKASLAAQEQGAFWDYHKTLFANFRRLKRPQLIEYARKHGLNVPRFIEIMDSPQTANHVRNDLKLARKVGARGTPTFFINGKRLVGAQPLVRFRAVVDAELKAVRTLIKQGIPRELVYGIRVKKNYVSPRVVRRRRRKPKPPKIVRLNVPIDPYNPRLGSDNAPATLVVFTDFQCPFCVRSHGMLRTLSAEFGPKLRIVLRHYPLRFHRYAELAAEASMAAHAQGKFWPFVHQLAKHYRKLSRVRIINIAKTVGLNLKRFNGDLDSHRYLWLVQRDKRVGRQLRVAGTPSYFLNGQKVTPRNRLHHLRRLITAKIREAAYFQKRRGVGAWDFYRQFVSRYRRVSGRRTAALHDVFGNARFKGLKIGRRGAEQIVIFDAAGPGSTGLLEALFRPSPKTLPRLRLVPLPRNLSTRGQVLNLALYAGQHRPKLLRKLVLRLLAKRAAKVSSPDKPNEKLIFALAAEVGFKKRFQRNYKKFQKAKVFARVIAGLNAAGLRSAALPLIIGKRHAMEFNIPIAGPGTSQTLTAVVALLGKVVERVRTLDDFDRTSR